MPRSRSSSPGRKKPSRKPIEQYEHEHEGQTRLNNPPVGLVDPENDPDAGKQTYQYDPHLDPQLTWAGKAEKRGGTRWVYRPAVSRGEGLCQLAQWVIGDFMREPDDRLYLIREGLRMVGFVPVGSPEALVENAGRQTKSACGPVGFR